jgi:flagellar basal-body rod protein FlgG
MRAAATGMMAQQTRIEVISNNLANVNTTGFKRSRAKFEDLLYRTVQGPQTVQDGQAQSLPEIQVGRGTRLSAVLRVDTQGPLEQTGRPMDIAIEGEGLLQVRLPDGTIGYTRDGGLMISDQGSVTTSSGYGIIPDVRIPPDARALTISSGGIISVMGGDGSTSIELGRIELARFTNPAGMRALGQNLYAETPASGQPIVGFPQDPGMGRIVQGSLEGSNVEIVQEMVDMITAMRAYEINSKAVQSSEELAEIANNLVR